MNDLTIYWVSTTLLCAVLLWSAFTYCFSEPAISGFRELGFPNFFRYQLVALKLLAALVLIAPVFSLRIKEWAYAGVALFFLTALMTHIAHRDSPALSAILLVFFAILVTSNTYLQRLPA